MFNSPRQASPVRRRLSGAALGGAALLATMLSCQVGVASPLCAAPWQRLAQNAQQFARPLPLTLAAAALAAPLALSPTGADYRVRVYTQTHLGGSYGAERVSVWAPYVAYPLAIVWYTGAALLGSCPSQSRASAIIQATTETILVVGFTKWATGRMWPLGGRAPDDPEALENPEDARTWRPFQIGLGAFPSGHTAFFFAAASAFRASSPDLGLLRYAGYPVAAAVGYLMLHGDHHFLSDVLSGAFLGEAIGSSAGRTWSDHEPERHVELLVIPTRAGGVALVHGTF